MNRGDIVVTSMPGDYGKPRPTVIVQSDFYDKHDSVTLCPLTSFLADLPLFRLTIFPNDINNLQEPSQIMTDKIATMKKMKITKKIGKLTLFELSQLDQMLRRWLAL